MLIYMHQLNNYVTCSDYMGMETIILEYPGVEETIYHISSNIGEHYIWRFAQKMLLAGF